MAMIRDNYVPGVLNPGDIMEGSKRDKLFSPNSDYFLVMQGDNNLVLYKVGAVHVKQEDVAGADGPIGSDGREPQSNHNSAIWSTKTNGKGQPGTATAQITREGALEVRAKTFRGQDEVIWTSDRPSKKYKTVPGSILRVQNDGQLRIYTHQDCWNDQDDRPADEPAGQ